MDILTAIPTGSIPHRGETSSSILLTGMFFQRPSSGVESFRLVHPDRKRVSRSRIGQCGRRLAIRDYVCGILGDFCNAFPFSVFGFSIDSWEFLWDLFLFFWFVCTFERDCRPHRVCSPRLRIT